jgi:type I restriction enzyme, S subunit
VARQDSESLAASKAWVRLARARRKQRGKEDHNQVLSVLKDVGVIPYEEKGNIGNKKSEDIARYKVVYPEDIVVNCMNVIIGSVGISRHKGCLSPVYYVLTRRSEADNSRYLNAVFQTKPFQKSLVRIGNGILAHRMRIPMELLKCEPFPKPPPEEQDAIVRFLDYINRRIERYIRAKRKLIALLNEQKQAIIHRAVTRGLDHNAKFKQSASRWFPEIPENCTVVTLRRVIHSAIDGPHFSPRYLDLRNPLLIRAECQSRPMESRRREIYRRIRLSGIQ